MKRPRSACHRSESDRRRRNSTSFFPINPADVAKRLGGVSKRIFRRGRPLLESLSAAKAPRTLRDQSGVTERILTRGHRLTTTASCNCCLRDRTNHDGYAIATAFLTKGTKKLVESFLPQNQKHPCLKILLEINTE